MTTRPTALAALTAVVLTVLGCAPAGPPAAEVSLEDRLRVFVDDAVTAAGFPLGVAVHLDSPALDLDWEHAVGVADPTTGEAMTPDHPVRIASNTKTYIAAAVLGLWEAGALDLDAPISGLLPEAWVELLEGDGYRQQAITVRHLLTHTGGLFDHSDSPTYGDDIVARPQHRWSLEEQLRLLVEAGDPVAEPGTVYRYSDTGYVLLGRILEDAAGLDLAGAVWSRIDRERLGLGATWFESLEPRPAGVGERAHQFYGEADVTGYDPSFDLWGGGGIAATVGDLARFTRALFAGEVFARPETLDTMLTTFDGLGLPPGAGEGGLPPGAYRMGVWVVPDDGLTLHRHTGFWGTSATWVPELDLVVTLTVNQHGAGPLFNDLQAGLVEVVRRSARAAAVTPAGR